MLMGQSKIKLLRKQIREMGEVYTRRLESARRWRVHDKKTIELLENLLKYFIAQQIGKKHGSCNIPISDYRNTKKLNISLPIYNEETHCCEIHIWEKEDSIMGDRDQMINCKHYTESCKYEEMGCEGCYYNTPEAKEKEKED